LSPVQSREISIAEYKPELDKLKIVVSDLSILLTNKRDALFKQRHDIKRLLYSSTKTNKKINIINDSLTKLQNIRNITEFKTFFGILIQNNELTSHRALGFGASDTYKKLISYQNDYLINLVDEDEPELMELKSPLLGF
jgi:hypothetical protein